MAGNAWVPVVVCVLVGCSGRAQQSGLQDGPQALAGMGSSAPAAVDATPTASARGSAPVQTSVAVAEVASGPCPAREPGFLGFDDPGLAEEFVAAQAVCEARPTIGWTCGDFTVGFDEDGCVSTFTALYTNHDDSRELIACMLEELAGACGRCARATTRRVYQSCTIL